MSFTPLYIQVFAVFFSLIRQNTHDFFLTSQKPEMLKLFMIVADFSSKWTKENKLVIKHRLRKLSATHCLKTVFDYLNTKHA